MEKLYVTKGYTGAHHVRGKKTNQIDTYIEFENIPLAGFKLGKNNGEMIDPRGFVIKAGSATMDRLLRTCTIYNGIILNTLVYRRFGSYYCPTHPEYKEEEVKKLAISDMPLFSIFKKSNKSQQFLNLGSAGNVSIDEHGNFFIKESLRYFTINANTSYCYPSMISHKTNVIEPSRVETKLSTHVASSLRNFLNYGYRDTEYPSAFNEKKLKLTQTTNFNNSMFGLNGYKFFKIYSSTKVKKLPLYYVDEHLNLTKDETHVGSELFLVIDSNDKVIGRVYLPRPFDRHTVVTNMTSYEIVGHLLNERFVFRDITLHYA